MIKIRKDVKKVQILTECDESEIHYIERSGSHYVYTYLDALGEGVVHQILPDDLDRFVQDLYKGFVNHWQDQGRTIVIDVEQDIDDIKAALNV